METVSLSPRTFLSADKFVGLGILPTFIVCVIAEEFCLSWIHFFLFSLSKVPEQILVDLPILFPDFIKSLSGPLEDDEFQLARGVAGDDVELVEAEGILLPVFTLLASLDRFMVPALLLLPLTRNFTVGDSTTVSLSICFALRGTHCGVLNPPPLVWWFVLKSS